MALMMWYDCVFWRKQKHHSIKLRWISNNSNSARTAKQCGHSDVVVAVIVARPFFSHTCGNMSAENFGYLSSLNGQAHVQRTETLPLQPVPNRYTCIWARGTYVSCAAEYTFPTQTHDSGYVWIKWMDCCRNNNENVAHYIHLCVIMGHIFSGGRNSRIEGIKRIMLLLFFSLAAHLQKNLAAMYVRVQCNGRRWCRHIDWQTKARDTYCSLEELQKKKNCRSPYGRGKNMKNYNCTACTLCQLRCWRWRRKRTCNISTARVYKF